MDSRVGRNTLRDFWGSYLRDGCRRRNRSYTQITFYCKVYALTVGGEAAASALLRRLGE